MVSTSAFRTVHMRIKDYIFRRLGVFFFSLLLLPQGNRHTHSWGCPTDVPLVVGFAFLRNTIQQRCGIDCVFFLSFPSFPPPPVSFSDSDMTAEFSTIKKLLLDNKADWEKRVAVSTARTHARTLQWFSAL